LIKIAIYLSEGLLKGHPNYRRKEKEKERKRKSSTSTNVIY
jgi:hypothetical protein